MIRTNNDIATLREDIGKRLSVFRQHKGLHQPEFAESLGIPPRSYQNYELGIRELPSSVILRLIKEYSIDAQWLLTGTDGMYHRSALLLAKDSLEEIAREASELDLTPNLSKLPEMLAIVVKQAVLMRDLNPDEIKRLIQVACSE